MYTQVRVEYEQLGGGTKFVDVAPNERVESLRRRFGEEIGLLSTSKMLRLKCGSRDLHDRDLVSTIDAPVKVMLRMLGGGPMRSESDDSSSDGSGGSEDEAADEVMARKRARVRAVDA